MLYRQLSELAVVGERSEAPKANQSRLRRPTPYSIEHYRHEGVRASKDDNPPVESPRGRSTSTTWTPTRTRAPTPHPNASRSRSRKEKTVRWTDSLEQESPEQKCEPATAPSRKKSAMKRLPATQQEEEKSTQKEEDQLEPAKPQIVVKVASQEAQSSALRRDRRSSIPRPKFAVTLSRSNTSKRIAAAERPPSPLIPQAAPAPLRLSQRRSRIPAIPSSASAPEVTEKTATRDFSFDIKPETLTVGSGSAHHSRPSDMPKDSFSTSQPTTSYLQAKPKRNATIRPPASKAEGERASAEDSSKTKTSSSAAPFQNKTIKPAASLPKSSSTQSFHSAKDFWAKKSASASVGDNDQNASNSKPASKPAPATSKLAAVDDPVDVTANRSSPSKSLPSKPLPSSTSTSSFHSVKDFWSGISASSSCGAVVSGSSPDPSSKPALPTPKSSSSSRDLPKTSMVSSLARYTVNEKYGARKGGVSGSVSSTAVTGGSRLPRSSSALPYRPAKSNITVPDDSSSKTSSSQPQGNSKPTAGSSVSAASKNSSSISNSSSYHTAPSHLTSASDTRNTNANASTPMAAIPTSIDTIQCELWNEIMNFCRSDSSSVPPGERYCDCDDCVLGAERDVAGCSTVARVGEGKKCRARRN